MFKVMGQSFGIYWDYSGKPLEVGDNVFLLTWFVLCHSGCLFEVVVNKLYLRKTKPYFNC